MKFVVVRSMGILGDSFLAPCGRWALDVSRAKVFDSAADAEMTKNRLESQRSPSWTEFQYSVQSRTRDLEQRLAARKSGYDR